jgi:hypothetical protein
MGRPRPGQISDALLRLREKALEEIEAPDPMVRSGKEVIFDHAHTAESPRVDEDYPKDVPQYDGPNNPHVGNGAGPPI